jgi:hypothetical protein
MIIIIINSIISPLTSLQCPYNNKIKEENKVKVNIYFNGLRKIKESYCRVFLDREQKIVLSPKFRKNS